MTEREALKLALEALEMFCEHGAILRPIETRDAIKEALAQPALASEQKRPQNCGTGYCSCIECVMEPEPVAWLHWLHGPVRLFLNKDAAMMELDRLNREYPVDKDDRQMKPLYTDPYVATPLPQRKPLTLGQKQRLWSSLGHKPTLKDRVNAYGSAIEAAHGITDKEQP